MAFVPYFDSQFSKPVVRQAIAIINRDIQAALDQVTGAPGSLPAFTTYDIAFRPKVQPPAILFAPQSVKIDPDYDAAEKHDTRIYCVVAVAHQSPSATAEMLEAYLPAVHKVLITAFKRTVFDWYSTALPLPAQPAAASPFAPGSLAPGLPANSLKLVWDEGWEYAELRREKEMFLQAAVMSWVFRIFET